MKKQVLRVPLNLSLKVTSFT